MPKIVAIPREEKAVDKLVLPEPELSFNVNPESGDITVTAVFKNVDSDTFKKSKQTIYLAKTAAPVDVEFEYEGQKQVLAVGTQPLQVKMTLSYPALPEEKAETPAEGSSENGGDPEDDEV